MRYLIYPASLLPHKNHFLLHAPELIRLLEKYSFIVQVTLPSPYVEPVNPVVQNLGRLSHNECRAAIKRSDALLFLSSCESLGVPLIEAAELHKPVVCPFLPYSRELLGGSPYYFCFDNFLISFEIALKTLATDLNYCIERKAILQKEMVPINDAIAFFFALLD